LPDAFISAVVSYVPFGVVGASCAAAGNRYGWLQHFFKSIIIFNNETCKIQKLSFNLTSNKLPHLGAVVGLWDACWGATGYDQQ